MTTKHYPRVGSTRLSGQLALLLIKACTNQHYLTARAAEQGEGETDGNGALVGKKKHQGAPGAVEMERRSAG